jgi:rhamnose transport system permease protein
MSETATSNGGVPKTGAPAPAPARPGSTPPAGPAYTGVDTSRQPVWRSFLRWEAALVVVLIAVLAFGAARSSTFLSGTTFFFTGLNMGEIAIMALPLLLIVMIGEIDLSVASMLGLSGAVMGSLYQHGAPIGLAILAALATGVAGGSLMGLLVARLGLPSIAVTIGGLTLFRGVAEIILPNPTTKSFPTGLADLGVLPIPGTQLAWSFGIFIVLAIVTGVVLHATPLGRSLFAMGLQPEAAQFAGIRVKRITFWLYVLSGLVCAFAGILFALKNASASYGAGTGLELTVVAVVLFGGVSIFGGRGTVIGVVLSVVIVGVLQQELTQMQVAAEVQNIVTGVLLLISVLVPNGAETLRRLRARARRGT